MHTLKRKTLQKQMLWNKHPFITVKPWCSNTRLFLVGNCRKPVLLTGRLKGRLKQANNKIPLE
jgi:hypothetical protein